MFLIASLIFGQLIFLVINDDLLSKFHQHGYKMINFRAELDSFNKDYVNHMYLKTFKYNRTTPVINATVNYKINIDDHRLEILVQLYKFASNEYRRFPTRFQINAKKAITENTGGCHDVFKCSNYEFNNINHMFRKNTDYYICNAILNETRFPPLIPTGSYRVEITALYTDKELFTVSAYMEFYYPVTIPKK